MQRFNLRYKLLVITVITFFVWAIAADLPFTFKAGDVISAEQMNENFTVLNTSKQERVAGECLQGSAIRAIDAAGQVICETDDVGSGSGGGYSAGPGLSLTGTVFSVDTSQTQRRVTGTCATGSAIRAIGADGTVECETDDVGSGGGGSAGVSSLNSKTGAVTLQAGTNITIDDSAAGQIRISASAGGSYSADETTLSLSGTTFSVKDSGIASAKLANGAVTAGKLAFPLAITGSSSGVAFSVTNSSANGIYGESSSGIGVWGASATRGVMGTQGDTSCAGTYGVGGCSETASGVYGFSRSATGVFGKSTNSNGVFGESASATGAGVYGSNSSGAGVYGQSTSSTGVYGTTGQGNGVWGISNSGSGVFGQSTTGYSGYFQGGGGTGYCRFNGGAGWSCTSDKHAKENFQAVDAVEILEAVATLPITKWTMKGDEDKTPHLGPVAQDFYAAFDLGEDDITINTADAQGVSLAAIQGLYKIVQEQSLRMQEQDERIAELEGQLAGFR